MLNRFQDWSDGNIEIDDKNKDACCCTNESPCLNELMNIGPDTATRSQHPRTGFALFLEEFLEKESKTKNIDTIKECVKSWKHLSLEQQLHYHRLSINDVQPLSASVTKMETTFSENDSTAEAEKNFEPNFESKQIKEDHSVPISASLTVNEKMDDSGDFVETIDPLNESTYVQALKRKRYSLKGDLDDLAFDIFCHDEMPIVRNEYERRLSDGEMLNELLTRWENLLFERKEDYISKAIIESKITN